MVVDQDGGSGENGCSGDVLLGKSDTSPQAGFLSLRWSILLCKWYQSCCGEDQVLPISFQIEWNRAGFLEEVSREAAW